MGKAVVSEPFIITLKLNYSVTGNMDEVRVNVLHNYIHYRRWNKTTDSMQIEVLQWHKGLIKHQETFYSLLKN